jgi:glucose-1-phosphate thymidylyltransferase short form/dTDP-4-dehydrorhamnose reductase
MSKVLIIGARGMLGQELAKTFRNYDLHLWDKDELDITDEVMVKEKLQELKPDLVINAAAYNAVDACEENFEIAQKVNHAGPVNLSRATQLVGATFVHYTTDYVFDGSKKDGYIEHNIPAPVSKYGESKYLGEEALEHNPDTFIIRTSRLFGHPASSDGAKKSFVEVMLTLANQKDELELVDEEYGSPTFVVDLAEQTRGMVEGGFHPGIYHITNEQACTWYEFAQEIFRQSGRTVNVKPVPSSKFPRPAKRPDFSMLLNTKLPRMRSWRAALKDFLKELGEYNPVSDKPKIEKDEEKKVDIKVELEKPVLPKVIPNINKSNKPTNMKGIILSGGKGTRLMPLTKITSKQLLPVYDKQMVLYPLQTLINAGIKEILVIIAPDYAGHYLNLLGSGKEWGVKITYEIQEEPKGLPEAFVIGEKFIGDDNVTMILGDNLFFDHDFTEDIQSFEKGGRIFAVEVPDPERFGVVEFDENKRVISIEEKPKNPKSNYAVPGIYIFDNRVCHIAKGIQPTWRPETDIVDVHRAFLSMNELDVRLVNGRWEDAGTFESLLRASNTMATIAYQKKMGYNKVV